MIIDDVTQPTHHDVSFLLDLTPTPHKIRPVAPRRASLFVYCSFVPRRAPSLVSLRSTAFANHRAAWWKKSHGQRQGTDGHWIVSFYFINPQMMFCNWLHGLATGAQLSVQMSLASRPASFYELAVPSYCINSFFMWLNFLSIPSKKTIHWTAPTGKIFNKSLWAKDYKIKPVFLLM